MAIRNIWEDDGGTRIDPFTTTPPFDGFFSATKGRNFAKQEYLVDWLDYHGYATGHVRDNLSPDWIEEYSPSISIMKCGIQFEERIMEHIRTLPFITMFTSPDPALQRMVRRLEPLLDDVTLIRDPTRRTCAEETYRQMEAGVPVINTGVVINPENQTFGAPDLIVRHDILAEMFDDVTGVNALSPGWTTDFNHNYHYRVVDVKWSTVKIDLSDREEFSLQLSIYDMALSRMQGLKDASGNAIFVDEGYVLAKKIRGTSPQNPFYRPAISDLSQHRTTVQNSLDWLARVSDSSARTWTPSNPDLIRSRNKEKGFWSTVIGNILQTEKDVTLLYEVGPAKKLDILLPIGITKYDDPTITGALIFPNTPNGVSANKISTQITLLSKSPGDTIPDSVSKGGAAFSVNAPDMRADTNIVDFYVDFETTAGWRREDWTNIRNIQDPGQIIYMVGCGYFDSTNGWTDSVFTTDTLEPNEERRIIQSWLDWMDSVKGTKNARVYHWSHAEKTAFNTSNARHAGIWNPPNWIDLGDKGHLAPGSSPTNGGLWVRDNISGLYDFGIKTVVKALNSVGLISLSWSDPLDGLAADVGALNLELERISTGGTTLRNILFDSSGRCLLELLEDYNRTDFRALYEILNYVRNNHL